MWVRFHTKLTSVNECLGRDVGDRRDYYYYYYYYYQFNQKERAAQKAQGLYEVPP